MKTLILCILLLMPLGGHAGGLPASAAERLRVFADCAGRLSALEEQQRLFDGAASERTARLKTVFDDLITATLPDARQTGISGRTALHWQVSAKLAQAALLQSAVFGDRPARSARDRALADRYLASCHRLILGV
ncbi:hypothetical protein [Actibacterium ureilyticum]|uniref:hypothetical protein n=1 Tax=Actibacterium ureilyticum TaxID=1590614 RepID=UPI001140C852|nr:hypothetical protein [Actibacterium ureilyticum]